MSMSLDLEDQVIVALRRITRAIDLHSRGLMHHVGLTAPQLAALQAIGRLQPITAGALAKSIHLSQATLTGILARLESRALVTKVRSSSDRRTVVVELTVEGRAVLERAPSLLHDRFRTELSKLQEWERTQMLATLQRIAAMMLADELDAAPVLIGGATTTEDVAAFLGDAAASVGIAAMASSDSPGDASLAAPPGDVLGLSECQVRD
jgi:DNA-binding MarR family transcriptional regulator